MTYVSYMQPPTINFVSLHAPFFAWSLSFLLLPLTLISKLSFWHVFTRNMLQSEVDSLRSQLGGGGRIGPSSAEIQLQQMNQALAQSHRDREELLAYITKISQQRLNEEANVMNDHSRGRFSDSSNANNGIYLHQQQQISSNNGTWLSLTSLTLYTKRCKKAFESLTSSDSIITNIDVVATYFDFILIALPLFLMFIVFFRLG